MKGYWGSVVVGARLGRDAVTHGVEKLGEAAAVDVTGGVAEHPRVDVAARVAAKSLLLKSSPEAVLLPG
jgi:hypothetical protein